MWIAWWTVSIFTTIQRTKNILYALQKEVSKASFLTIITCMDLSQVIHSILFILRNLVKTYTFLEKVTYVRHSWKFFEDFKVTGMPCHTCITNWLCLSSSASEIVVLETITGNQKTTSAKEILRSWLAADLAFYNTRIQTLPPTRHVFN